MPFTSEDFWGAIRGGSSDIGQWDMGQSIARRGGGGGAASAFWRGGFSALLPIEATPLLQNTATEVAARERLIQMAKDRPGLQHPGMADPNVKLRGAGQKISLTAWEKMTTKGTRAVTRRVGRAAGRWIGPVITTYRLGTEVDVARQGVGGAVSKTGRILGGEFLSTAATTAGMTAGAAIGTAIAPGIGTVIGGAVGFVAGMAGGAVLEWSWNKAMDIVEAPFRAASAGWKYFKDAGKRSTRLELGGRVSAGNRSRMAYTMRSRALQEMNRSGINARSLLGQEASMMHIRT